jgi:CPA1 family monovalent cation:H+ antiporter
MNLFDIASIVIALTALFGYANHRLLRLPPTTGMLALALAASLLLLAVNALAPGWGLRRLVVHFLAQIDFYSALMHGMLCFLLFAGSLHLDLKSLHANRGTVIVLATVGVLISTALIGLMTWLLFGWLGLDVPLLVCLVFGALISPTDPIAVIALLKILHAPREVQAQIAGESLFNDGVGVVVFFAMLSLAGLGGEAQAPHVAFNPGAVAGFFALQVGGGVLLGLVFGYGVFVALKSIEEPALELLITLAMVMVMYTLSFAIDVSGPIAVVVAGILLGGYGRRLAMTPDTVRQLDAFWGMIDDILNGALFLLLGLQVLAVAWSGRLLGAGMLVVPLVLLARGISVGLPIGLLKTARRFHRGIVPILTWGGLRGGISVAMVLSLPPFPARDLLVGCTYLVMLFSVLVQGLTMERLLTFYGIGEESAARAGERAKA